VKALLTGISGQDGSYLAESLLRDGWELVGMVRRISESHRGRINSLIETYPERLRLFCGDLRDTTQLRREITKESPDAIYHLAGQSHVGASFRIPETTLSEVANATLSLLEICRNLAKPPRVLLIGSSEVFGDPEVVPQNEATPHRPISPYGCAKSCSIQLGAIYRSSFDIPVSTIISYNHESVRRGESFVTRKITSSAARIAHGSGEVLELGNMDGSRDWGFAPEYVEGMRMVLQASVPGDYILATGTEATVREFAQRAFEAAGIPVEFEGAGVEEVGRLRETGEIRVRVNPEFFRRVDSRRLVGDASKAKAQLGWEPTLKGADVATKIIEGEFNLLSQ